MKKKFTKDEINILKDEFKKELHDLLAKYNADIYVDLDGDTHGVSCAIVIDIDNTEIIRSNDSISSNDI